MRSKEKVEGRISVWMRETEKWGEGGVAEKNKCGIEKEEPWGGEDGGRRGLRRGGGQYKEEEDDDDDEEGGGGC